ncbi:GAF and ANTAR domain-containing protein [Plantactinospora sp. BB1]|uniref:GAF and ANTAR domain-containing protein n=1 Tax=Plantactinospora sp. BB1 TaxID=2071627 RepID=UPI000D15B517|nr:GAF and ANTAR domain-containing protein [Plantactinospora sp. BB1]AVT38546.1 histidine kinase [Plantactinospora sp. BB1]
MSDTSLDPTEAFTQLGRIRLAETDLDGVLDRIAQLARRTLTNADEVSVTLLSGDEPRTAAFTSRLALSLDERQYQAGHGPCLDAARAGATISLPDTATESRWPEWSAQARAEGVGSSLSIGLPVQETVFGALNVHSAKPEAFDDEAIMLAEAFAGYAAVALANAHLYDTTASMAQHMQMAMQSRAVIEQAKGIVMAERRCTPDEAFAILAKVSQDSNRKLRDVAAALVERASGGQRR